MILNLNKFGKFKNKSFEISDGLTLFYGENESGKTTIFDSLMLLLSENKKTSSFAKQIKSRYGDDIDIYLEPEIEPSKKMHPQSYNNLYAIRQSEIIFEMSDSKKDSKDWESEIKKKLFSSDIDIGKIISEIKSEYSGKSQNSIPSILKNLKYRKEEIKDELNELYSKANTEVNKKDNLKELNEEYNKNDILIKEKIAEYTKLSETINSQKNSELKNVKLELIKLITDFNKKDKFLSENIYLKEDHSPKINDITKKIEDSQNNISYINGKIEALKKSEEEKNNTDYESRKIRIDRAIKKIDDLIKKNYKIPKAVFLGIIVIIASFLSFYFKNPYWFLIILPSIPFMFIKDSNNDKTINDILYALPELNIDNYNLDISSLKDILTKELVKIELILSKNDDEELNNYIKELEDNMQKLEIYNKELSNFF